MNSLLSALHQPMPWYVAGPLIGLTVPALLFIGNKSFGISSNLRHVCAIVPNRIPFLNYDWRKEGLWNLSFALGIVLGGLLTALFLQNDQGLILANSTSQDLAALGIEARGNLAPSSIFSLAALSSWKNWLFLLIGGFLIGFGTNYAGGCTSGHAISGLANLQLPSLVAVVGFFIGGLISTFLLLPYILPLLSGGVS